MKLTTNSYFICVGQFCFLCLKVPNLKAFKVDFRCSLFRFKIILTVTIKYTMLTLLGAA